MNDYIDEEKDGLAVFVVGDKNNGEKLIQLCFSVPDAENKNADWFTRFYKDGKWHTRHPPYFMTQKEVEDLLKYKFQHVEENMKRLRYARKERPFGIGFRHGTVKATPHSDAPDTTGVGNTDGGFIISIDAGAETVIVNDGGLNAPGNSFSVGAIYGTPPLGGFAGTTSPTSNLYLDFSTPFGVLFGDEFLLGVGGGGGRLFGNDGRWGFDFNRRHKHGELSYELSMLTGIHWYNHAIPGSTISALNMRSAFDVRGSSRQNEPVDTRKSVPSHGCEFVMVSVGRADVLAGRSAEEIIKDLEQNMSYWLYGYVNIVMKIPLFDLTDEQYSVATEVNLWFESMGDTVYGMIGKRIIVVDSEERYASSARKRFIYKNSNNLADGFTMLGAKSFAQLLYIPTISNWAPNKINAFKLMSITDPENPPAGWLKKVKLKLMQDDKVIEAEYDEAENPTQVIEVKNEFNFLYSPLVRVQIVPEDTGVFGFTSIHLL